MISSVQRIWIIVYITMQNLTLIRMNFVQDVGRKAGEDYY